MVSPLQTDSGDQNSKDHIPVMLGEVLKSLASQPDQLIVDGTFGAGGYSEAILRSGSSVLAIDRDPNAVSAAAPILQKYAGRLRLHHGKFSDLTEIAEANNIDGLDGVVLDIGVSSMQLDQAERGFSFGKDGPLDMRMAQEGVSAADVVNNVPRTDLTRIIGILGEEKKAGLVSAAIERARKLEAITTTLQLAKIVEKAIGRNPKVKIHPATRTFQALRIFVNRELEELAKVLFASEKLLKKGGRLVVVTFHSLEDRIVKQFFANRGGAISGSRHLPQTHEEEATFSFEKKGAIKASAGEIDLNARSRSAKLRYGIRTAAPSRAEDYSIFGFPNLISLDVVAGLSSEGRANA